MINVLNIVDSLGTGGTEKVLMNTISNTYKTVNHTIMIKNTNRNIYQDYLEKLDIKIIIAPPFTEYFNHSKFVNNYLKENKASIDIIHYYGGSLNYYLPIRLANKYDIPIIIHSHNSQAANHNLKIMHQLFRAFHNRFGKSYNIACSEEAGKWMFGDSKYDLVINGIDIDKYRYNSVRGLNIKNQFFSKDAKVIGNFGRFNRQKNQKYLIDFLAYIRKTSQDYYLLLIGEGELEEPIREQIENLNLNEFVKILDFQQNIEDYYGVIDAFMMSSLFEGLPLVLIEAQAAGVPLLISDEVDKSIQANGNVEFFNLNDDESLVYEKLVKILESGRQVSSLYGGQFDVKVMSKKILDLYLKILKEDSSNI
ncbi:glycosyltransferase [Aerococcus urinaeequi]|uniref:glycosyltransferase n=1 Tax=Aerococcus urinaeequi TaxID=51665 RepID=UPI003D6A1418